MSVEDFITQVLTEADACLCSHERHRHKRNAAGPNAGGCLAALCGCLWFRPDPAARNTTTEAG